VRRDRNLEVRRVEVVEGPRAQLQSARDDRDALRVLDELLAERVQELVALACEAGARRVVSLDFGKMVRQVWLPAPVDEEKVQTRFENGVLSLDFPKKIDESRRRQITV
jgi:hypothetical protein